MLSDTWGVSSMATWKSALFTDIRNKLGESVVFSMWKGRPYFRSYVRPANPNSLKQKANRAQLANIVAMYQANIKGDADLEAAWNAEALSRQISGYNAFTKFGRGTMFGTVNLAAGSLSVEVTESTIPEDRMAIMVYDLSGTTYLLPTTKRGVGTYTAADFTAYTPAAGDLIYVVDTKVIKDGDTAATAALYKACSHWVINETLGTADALVVTS